MKRLANNQSIPEHDPAALQTDLQTEYYAILEVITGFDQRLMTVKGWSVTLSLAGLGLGFQQQHYALFALAGATALAFWYMDLTMKQHQVRYYSRMRDIEVAAYDLNHIHLEHLERGPEDQKGPQDPPDPEDASAPRIDMYWSFKGFTKEQAQRAAKEPRPLWDWRTDRPERHSPDGIHLLLRRAYRMRQVLLPHVVAVVLGFLLFVGALAHVGGLAQLRL